MEGALEIVMFSMWLKIHLSTFVLSSQISVVKFLKWRQSCNLVKRSIQQKVKQCGQTTLLIIFASLHKGVMSTTTDTGKVLKPLLFMPNSISTSGKWEPICSKAFFSIFSMSTKTLVLLKTVVEHGQVALGSKNHEKRTTGKRRGKTSKLAALLGGRVWIAL